MMRAQALNKGPKQPTNSIKQAQVFDNGIKWQKYIHARMLYALVPNMKCNVM